ncbi:hypothetical protein CEP53_012482 [Fusarium sp. AF-6]|nr:hypothetical protein CEP53_012482 [Fusarium sp. AF-6]
MCHVTIYCCSHKDCPLFTTAHIIYCEGARNKRTFTRSLKERVARFDQRECISIPTEEGCTKLEIDPYAGIKGVCTIHVIGQASVKPT